MKWNGQNQLLCDQIVQFFFFLTKIASENIFAGLSSEELMKTVKMKVPFQILDRPYLWCRKIFFKNFFGIPTQHVLSMFVVILSSKV